VRSSDRLRVTHARDELNISSLNSRNGGCFFQCPRRNFNVDIPLEGYDGYGSFVKIAEQVALYQSGEQRGPGVVDFFLNISLTIPFLEIVR
jgi:hypothetical protein